MKAKSCLWQEEIKNNGWSAMLKDRLAFHNALYVSQVAEATSRSRATVMKHFRRLVETGRAQWRDLGDNPAITIVK